MSTKKTTAKVVGKRANSVNPTNTRTDMASVRAAIAAKRAEVQASGSADFDDVYGFLKGQKPTLCDVKETDMNLDEDGNLIYGINLRLEWVAWDAEKNMPTLSTHKEEVKDGKGTGIIFLRGTPEAVYIPKTAFSLVDDETGEVETLFLTGRVYG